VNNKKRKPENYLKLPYSRILIPDEESGTFTAEIIEFPGCIAQGDTPHKAYKSLEKVARSWLEAAINLGQEIPSPSLDRGFGGKFALRLPKSLHRQATIAAEQDGTSLNQFIVAAVAEKVGASNLYENLAKRLEAHIVQTAINEAIRIIDVFSIENQATSGQIYQSFHLPNINTQGVASNA
jgi:predicted RNase H-like HicB family nuclease